MAKEFIFKLSDALYDEKTGEAVFMPENMGELVRCKDCYRAKEDTLYGGLWCGGHIRHAQWFCADGERRTDAN